MKHLLNVNDDSKVVFKDYSVVYHQNVTDKNYVKKYYETPFIKILTGSHYYDTSIIPLVAKKCGNINGDITWSHTLPNDVAVIEGDTIKMIGHYVGTCTLSASAEGVNTATKEIYIECNETPTQYEYTVTDVSIPEVNWDDTSAEISFKYNITEKFASKPSQTTTIDATHIVSFSKNEHTFDYTTGTEYVDLGLSNGQLWAKCNIGAKHEYEDGLYFQWADTEGYNGLQDDTVERTGLFSYEQVNNIPWKVIQQGYQKIFDWAHYKYCNGMSNTLTKYCLHENYGTVDGKSELEEIDDAAVQHLHDGSHIYNVDDAQHLVFETFRVWTDGETVSVKQTNSEGQEVLVDVVYPAGMFFYKAKSQEDRHQLNNAPSGLTYSPNATQTDGGTIVDGDTHIFFSTNGWCINKDIIEKGQGCLNSINSLPLNSSDSENYCFGADKTTLNIISLERANGYGLRSVKNTLKFTATGASTLGLTNSGNNAPILEKSTDGSNWETWDYSTISLADGESVYIKGNNPNGFNSSGKNYSKFTMTGSIACTGNVMHLLGENVTDIPCDYCFYNLFNNCTGLTTAPELTATTLKQNCYEGMFSGCTSLTTAPELPATTLASACYDNMFNGCSSLTSTSELPATTLASGCYYGMFSGCTSLMEAPELPATTLTSGCYAHMFYNCTVLTTAPELPATTLASSCYQSMFQGCTNLTEASALPATTLASYCYSSMFQGCTSLTTAPELPATSLTSSCYNSMFEACSSLNYIKVGATSWDDNAGAWTRGVSSTGIFVKPIDTEIPTDDYNGIPIGWTVENIDIETSLILNNVETILDTKNVTYLTSSDSFVIKPFNYPTVMTSTVTISEFDEASSEYTIIFSEKVNVRPHGFYEFETPIIFANKTQYKIDVKLFDFSEKQLGSTSYIVEGIIMSALKFTATGASTLGLSNTGNNAPILEKSTDGSNWETWDYSTISLADGESVYIKGNNPNGFSSSVGKYSKFTMTGSIACAGNVMHLLGENVTDIPCEHCFFELFKGCASLTTAPELPATTLANYCYLSMFSGCTSLTTAPSILPATTTKWHCYSSMFYGCTSLTSVPELPATELDGHCYSGMFYGCTSLTSVPELPATELAEHCYDGMFKGCTSLTTVSELPATTLASSCYNSMFSGCSSLTTAPSILPATTLAISCYDTMFQGCSSLTEAPELPAPTLVQSCYSSMFLNCSNLNYIKVGATSWNTALIEWWAVGVSSTGTFVKPINTNISYDNHNGIPSGWTIENV